MQRAFMFRTKAGPFYIVQQRDGRWEAMFGDEALGSYTRPEQAAEDLAGGATFWPSCGNPANFGISEDLGDWEQVRK